MAVQNVGHLCLGALYKSSGGFSHGSKGSMEPPFLPDNLSIKQAHGTVILEKYSDQLLQRTLNFHERV